MHNHTPCDFSSWQAQQMEMRKEHRFLELDGETLIFRLPQTSPFSAELSTVAGVYQVASGWDVHGNDQMFWVVDLPDRRVILPDEAPGVYPAFAAARTALARAGRLFSATCYMPPKAWRAKRLGFIPSLQIKATVVPRQAFTSIIPDWTATPLSGDTWQEKR